MLKLTKRSHFDAFAPESPPPTSCTPFVFSQQNLPNNPFQQLQQQQQQQQQQQLQQQQQQLQLQQQQQQQQQLQLQTPIQQHSLDTTPLKRSRLNSAQSNSTKSADYSYFNEVQSPISNIVSNIDKFKPSVKKQPNQPIVFNSEPKSFNNFNNNTTTTNKNILINNNNNNNNNSEKLFSLEEVREILKKALEEHEAKLRREYENIVQQKLMEQFHSFSSYNESYISRQLRDSEFSYMS